MSRETAVSAPLRLACLLILSLFLPACATVRTNADGTPVPLSRSTYPYRMAPLDTAELRLPDSNRLSLQVSPAGTVEVKDRTVRVEGMPVADFRALLHRAYGADARVDISEFRPNRVTVLGEVFHQIHTQLDDGPMRVMDAIAVANGFTSLANRRRVRLVRQNAGTTEVYELDLREMMYGRDLGQNILLKPGDVITVPRNFL